jgi:hypothetical protein
LAPSIPAQYPGVEILNVNDTPGYKAIVILGVTIENSVFKDPRFSSFEQHTRFEHIAQADAENEDQPLVWNQTLSNGLKRTIPYI